MAPKSSLILDPNDENQVAGTSRSRTIYDARYHEIFWKSFVAGFSLGLGKMMANLIFFSLILVLFLSYVQPYLDQFTGTLQRLIPGASTTTQTQYNSLNPLMQIFSTLRQTEGLAGPTASPSPSPTAVPRVFFE